MLRDRRTIYLINLFEEQVLNLLTDTSDSLYDLGKIIANIPDNNIEKSNWSQIINTYKVANAIEGTQLQYRDYLRASFFDGKINREDITSNNIEDLQKDINTYRKLIDMRALISKNDTVTWNSVLTYKRE